MNSHLSYEPHLGHQVLVHKSKRLRAAQWCEKKFGRNWNPLDNRAGLWTMIWAGHNKTFDDMKEFDQYRFCFADDRDLMIFMLGCP
jgi:hypothetical protein